SFVNFVHSKSCSLNLIHLGLNEPSTFSNRFKNRAPDEFLNGFKSIKPVMLYYTMITIFI
ncbi:hypothetical protein, partial [Pseudolactococcus chungangensis]